MENKPLSLSKKLDGGYLHVKKKDSNVKRRVSKGGSNGKGGRRGGYLNYLKRVNGGNKDVNKQYKTQEGGKYSDPNKKTILDGKKIESPFLPKSRDPNELAKLIDKIVESKAFQDDLATKQYEYIKNLSTPEFVMKDWERIFESLTKKYKTINRKIPFSEKIVNYFGLSFERFYIKKFREKNIQVRGEKEYELLTRK